MAADVVQRLRSIWTQVLRTSAIDDADHFVGCGGDSIAAVECIHLVAAEFGVEIPQETLYLDETTFATFAEVVSEAIAETRQ